MKENENNPLKQIEAFAKQFEDFMLTDKPRKHLKELNETWQQILLMLEKEQRRNHEIFYMLLSLLKTKLEYIYTSKNKNLGMSFEVISGDVHYITYEIIATALFQITFITDHTLFETDPYFNHQEFSKSLEIAVNRNIGPNVLEELKKEQKQKIQELRNNYKSLLQTYTEMQAKNSKAL